MVIDGSRVLDQTVLGGTLMVQPIVASHRERATKSATRVEDEGGCCSWACWVPRISIFESWPVGAPYQRDVENVFVLSPMGIEPYYLVFFFFWKFNDQIYQYENIRILITFEQNIKTQNTFFSYL